MSEWNPESVRQALDLELHPIDGEEPITHTSLAERILKESAPEAATVLRKLALYAETESLRARCSMYLLDRVFGKEPIETPESEDALRKFVESAVRKPAAN